MKLSRPTAIRSIAALFLLVLIGVGAWVYVVPAQVLTRAGLERILQEVSAQLTLIASKKDVKATLAYDTIEFKGWGPEREAYIRNPHIDLTEEGSSDTFTFSTEFLIVKVDKGGATMIHFPKGISVKGRDQLLARIEYPDKPIYRYESVNENGAVLQKHRLIPPTEFAVFPYPNGLAVLPINVAYAVNPMIQVTYDPQAQRQVSEYRIENLSVDDRKSPFKIGKIDSIVTRAFDGENHVAADYDLHMENASFANQLSVLGPITVEAKLHYSGEADASPLTDTPRSGINELTVNKLNLQTQHFSASAVGMLQRSADDGLPYGKIEITAANLRQALEGMQLPDEERTRWISVVQKVTGQTLEELDNAIFQLTREKHGEFHVGGATADEIAAEFFAPTPAAAE